MRNFWQALALAVVVAPASLLGQYRCPNLPDTPIRDTAVIGTVLEDSTLRPLPLIFLAVNRAPFGMTDCSGRFALPVGNPGDTIGTMSEYFFTQTRVVPSDSAHPPQLAFRLTRLPPKPLPTDSLLGSWFLRLWKDDGGAQPYLEATLTILPGEWTPLGTVEPVLHSPDLGHLMSDLGGWQPPDSLSVTIAGDSVSIWLTPGVFDAGYSLNAVIVGDSVLGAWCSHNFGHTCERVGRATLTRH
jgi:hypothetical protein